MNVFVLPRAMYGAGNSGAKEKRCDLLRLPFFKSINSCLLLAKLKRYKSYYLDKAIYSNQVLGTVYSVLLYLLCRGSGMLYQRYMDLSPCMVIQQYLSRKRYRVFNKFYCCLFANVERFCFRTHTILHRKLECKQLMVYVHRKRWIYKYSL